MTMSIDSGTDTTPSGTTSPAGVPFVLGGPWFARSRDPRRDRRSIVGAVVLLAVIIAPLPGLWRLPGGPMEEGFVLVFPERILAGDLPHRDFLYLYGPGALYALAGWFWAVGTTIEAERIWGLGQHLATITAMVTLAGIAGRRIGVAVGAFVTIFVFTATGLVAMAWSGAVALGLWSVVAGCRAHALSDDARRTRRWWFTSGVLAGLALGFRPDLVLALAAVTVILIASTPRTPSTRRHVPWRHLGSGWALGVSPLILHMVMVGPRRSIEGMVWDPVVRLRAGRALPRPPSWDRLDGMFQVLAETVPPWWGLPHLRASSSLFLWFFAMILVAIGVTAIATWWWWRERSPHSVVIAATAWFGLGLLPQGLQRPDSTHLALASTVTWPWAIVLGVMWWRRRRPARPHHVIVAVAAFLAATLVLTPLFTYRSYLFAVRLGLGQLPAPVVVERNERHFWLGDARVADAYQGAVDALDARLRPGERLIVAPADMSRTPYGDTFIYHLFPDLVAGTYHLEMEPGIANASGSSLAAEVAAADWVILGRVWEGWREPNTSAEPGSTAANEVLASQFCEVASFEDGLVTLVRRCDAITEPEGSASPP